MQSFTLVRAVQIKNAKPRNGIVRSINGATQYLDLADARGNRVRMVRDEYGIHIRGPRDATWRTATPEEMNAAADALNAADTEGESK